MSVFHILEAKERAGAPSEVVSVETGSSVADAVALMSKHRIGAVLVRDGESIAGILSERDLVHLIARDGAEALGLDVAEAMTKDLVTCTRTDTIDHAMSVMTEGRFRHLPVMQDGRLIGMISIGDVVKRKIEDAEHEVENLKGYIAS